MRNGLVRVLSSPIGALRRANYIFHGTRSQARCLVSRYGALMEPTAFRYLKEYAYLDETGFATRKTFPFRHQLWFDDLIRNAGLLLCI
jgi:hypothetical protein